MGQSRDLRGLRSRSIGAFSLKGCRFAVDCWERGTQRTMTVFELVLEFIAHADTSHSLPALDYGRVLSSLTVDVESRKRLLEVSRSARRTAARQEGYRMYFDVSPSNVIQRLSLPWIGRTMNRKKMILLYRRTAIAIDEASTFIRDFAPNAQLAGWYLRGDFQSAMSCVAAFTMLQQYHNRGETDVVLGFLRKELRQALLALQADAFYGAVLPPEDCDEEEALFWCRVWVTGMASRLREVGLG